MESYSRRNFLRTLALGVCALPASRALAAMGKDLGMHPSTPVVTFDSPPPAAIPATAPTAPAAPSLAPAFTRAAISTPELSLTFDDGPHGTLTPRLLDILKERRAKATFYVIGQNVEAYPDIARRIVEEGHEIANHTWTHPALSGLSAGRVAEELRKTHEKVREVTGVTMTNLRPPYGAVNDMVRKVAFDEFGYITVLWSVDPMDWKYRNAARVNRQLVQGAAPGAVLLCHDIHKTTVAAIPPTLDQIAAKGFSLLTIDQLLARDESGRLDSNQRPPAPKAGALPS
jgi:peptidoglycan/xylan/chitin deacetylase (PgdA/CDA1 family)